MVVPDARGMKDFCSEVINPGTIDKDSDSAFEEDEATANASDNELECLDGELIDKDGDSCTRALASGELLRVVDVGGDDEGEVLGPPVTGVLSEEALNLSAS